MKNMVLILVCAALLTFFIAFDYLLWDRERNAQSINTLEDSIDSKDATIGALGREIKDLENYSNQLSNKLKLLEEEKKSLEEKVSDLESEIQEMKGQIKRRDEFISTMESIADYGVFESILKDWAEKINEGRYEEAYQWMKLKTDAGMGALSFADFTGNYMTDVKSIEIGKMEISKDEALKYDKADIAFLTELNVEKSEENKPGKFNEGMNKMIVGFDYDSENETWFMSYISIAN